MENVYDIREEKKLFWDNSTIEDILSEETRNDELKNVVVVAYLYYIDSIEFYFDYFIKLHNRVHLVIISSVEEVINKVRNMAHDININNIEYRLKKNRGRDVAALLVSAADLFEKYDFLCFLHDKKEKTLDKRESIFRRTKSMWDSLLSSENNVFKVLSIFRSNPSVGLLLPPTVEILGWDEENWYKGQWYSNYENTKKLGKKLGINANFDQQKEPIALGTCFWCRTSALKKLIDANWKNEDFLEEPLPNDGTLSHAIERIFPFVAQDAGFNSGTIISKELEPEIICSLLSMSHKLWRLSGEKLGIESYNDIQKIDRIERKFREISGRVDTWYVYGAGVIAQKCFKQLRSIEIDVRAFITTAREKTQYMGRPVITLDRLELSKRDGIIIAVTSKYEKEVIEQLMVEKIDSYIVSWQSI